LLYPVGRNLCADTEKMEHILRNIESLETGGLLLCTPPIDDTSWMADNASGLHGQSLFGSDSTEILD
jgi:hypothetical protein